MATSVIKVDRFESGDTYTFSDYIVGGYVTGSSKQIAFGIYMPKQYNAISSVTFTYIQMRTISGRIDVDASDISSVTISPKGNYYIRFIVNLDTALSVTTNTPMGAQISGTITFS